MRFETRDNRGKGKFYYNDEGRRHRIDGPAVTRESNDGVEYLYEWFKNGKRHRLCGPAVTIYFEDGKVEYEWYVDGVRYRNHESYLKMEMFRTQIKKDYPKINDDDLSKALKKKKIQLTRECEMKNKDKLMLF